MRLEAFRQGVGAGARRGLVLGALGIISLLVSSTTAAAAAPEPAPAPPVAAPANGRRQAPVLLVLHGASLDPARLEASLEAELGCDVVLGAAVGEGAPSGVLTIAHRPEAKELAVTWERGGQTLTRLVAAPPDVAAVEADAVLLAGNLAREQVATLLPAAPEAPPPAPPEPPASPEPAQPERWAATIGVFYPLATHNGHADVTSSFDLNLLYSRVGSIDGAQLGGVNVVGRDEGGAPSSMRGLELGFLANLVAGEARGVQFAGLFNQTSGDVEGLQLAGGANFALGRVQGVQGAFAFNRAASVKGLQLGLVNVGGDVDGLQIGLVNVARRVRGASVGIVNVADDIEGLPLAPFSVTRTGGVHPTTWGGSGGYGNVGIKLATRHTYTLFFGSYHRKYGLDLYGGGVAIGGSVGLGAGFRSDFDLSGTYLVAPELSYDPSRVPGYHEQLFQPRLRWLLAFRLAEHFGLFGGVAALGNIRSELGWDRVTASIGPEVFGGVEL